MCCVLCKTVNNCVYEMKTTSEQTALLRCTHKRYTSIDYVLESEIKVNSLLVCLYVVLSLIYLLDCCYDFRYWFAFLYYFNFFFFEHLYFTSIFSIFVMMLNFTQTKCIPNRKINQITKKCL